MHTSHPAPFTGALSGQVGGAAHGGHRPVSQCPPRQTYMQPQQSGSGSQLTPSGPHEPPSSPHVPPVPAVPALPELPALPDAPPVPPALLPLTPPPAPPWPPVPLCAPPSAPASRTLSSCVDPPQAPCPSAKTDGRSTHRSFPSSSIAHTLAPSRRLERRSQNVQVRSLPMRESDDRAVRWWLGQQASHDCSCVGCRSAGGQSLTHPTLPCERTRHARFHRPADQSAYRAFRK